MAPSLPSFEIVKGKEIFVSILSLVVRFFNVYNDSPSPFRCNCLFLKFVILTIVFSPVAVCILFISTRFWQCLEISQKTS